MKKSSRLQQSLQWSPQLLPRREDLEVEVYFSDWLQGYARNHQRAGGTLFEPQGHDVQGLTAEKLQTSKPSNC